MVPVPDIVPGSHIRNKRATKPRHHENMILDVGEDTITQ